MKDKETKHRRRKRRYISRRPVFFCLLLALALGGFAEGFLSFHFLCALLITVLLSGLQTVWAVRSVRLAQSVTHAVVAKNETFTLDIYMENHAWFSFLPFVEARVEDFYVLTHPPQRILSTILPRERVHSSLPVRFPYRGRWPLGLSCVYVTDLTGFFRLRVPLPSPLQITVNPNIIPLRACALKSTSTPPMRRRMPWLEEDPFTRNDVRDYQYGDPLKRIHWKLSARKGHFLSKVMDRDPAPASLFLLDITPPDGDAIEQARLSDRIVEILIAVLHDCLTKNNPVRLVHRMGDGLYIDEQNGRDDFSRLVHHLAVLPFTSHNPLHELDDVFKRTDIFGFLIFTICLTDELAAMACRRHATGAITEIIALSSSMTKPLNANLPIYLLPEEGDFAPILEGGMRHAR